MPDISMCTGTGCPLKENCYRATAKPSLYQYYYPTPPIKDGECDHYLKQDENEKRTNIQKKGKGVDKGIKPLRG